MRRALFPANWPRSVSVRRARRWHVHLKLLAGFSNLAPHHVKRGARKFSFAAAFAKLVRGARRCHSTADSPVGWASKFSVAGKSAALVPSMPCSKKKIMPTSPPRRCAPGCRSVAVAWCPTFGKTSCQTGSACRASGQKIQRGCLKTCPSRTGVQADRFSRCSAAVSRSKKNGAKHFFVHRCFALVAQGI